MSFKRIISKVQDYQQGDLLIEVAPSLGTSGMQVFVANQPGDLAGLMGALFGTHHSGLTLADTPIDIDGLPRHAQEEVLDAIQALVHQWGTSVIDPAHGIANLISNARTLLASPRIAGPITDRPALAIAAGPSTSALMERLQDVAGGFLVVAADGALKPLCEAKIRVDACAPLERLKSTADKLAGCCIADDVVFAGSPFAPPQAVGRFARHTLWPTCDPIFDWYGCPEDRFNPGSTSGTAAVTVALALTTGPVYLVGHDLCDGHMRGADVSAAHADAFDAERLGNDGTLKPTKTPWLRAKNDLEGLGGSDRLVNVGGFHGHGLTLAGIPLGDLPPTLGRFPGWNPLGLIQDLAVPTFIERARHLPDDLEAAALAASGATTLEHVSLEVLANERNRDALAYLLRGVYAQASLERRMGRAQADVIALVCEAIANTASTVCEPLRQVIREVA